MIRLPFAFSALVILSAFAAALPVTRQTLDAKLTRQWQRYEAARALALTHVVGRDEWEKTLQLSPGFTPEELRALHARQDAMVIQSKAASEKESPIPLDAIRRGAPDRLKRFCADLPKGGQLHVHDWGTMSETGMTELLLRLNPVVHPLDLREELKPRPAGATKLKMGAAFLYPAELAFLESLGKRYGKEFRYEKLKPIEQAKLRDLFFLAYGSHPFARFEAVFTMIIRLILDKPPFDPSRLLYDDYFSRAQAENVSYVEIAAPGELTPAAMAALENWSQDLQHRFGIVAKAQHAFFRAWSVEDLSQAAQKLLALTPPSALVGINLVNNEAHDPALEKGQPVFIPFLRAEQDGKTRLHRSMHAGELGDPRNVRDSLILGAERIGHGVGLRDDLVTLEYARLHQIPVEANLTSNLRLGVVKSYREHPFLRFLRLGLKVSLSTDDEGVFGTDINQECIHAISETDINYAELRRLIRNSIETSFASPEEKAILMAKVNAQLLAFEGRWQATH